MPSTKSYLLIFVAIIISLAGGCSVDKDDDKNAVKSSDQVPRDILDASERQGAIVIRPALDSDMRYDPATGDVTDLKTGEYLGVRQQMRSGGIYAAGIHNRDGAPVYEYQLKYSERKDADGNTTRTIWQVFWALRGEDSGKNMGDVQIPGRVRAQHDSLERLAMFLRARQHGIAQGENNNEVVVVDRRSDDTQGERIW